MAPGSDEVARGGEREAVAADVGAHPDPRLSGPEIRGDIRAEVRLNCDRQRT